LINTLLFRAKHFIHHIFTANGAHALHSPFLYKLYNEAIIPSPSSLIPEIERIRKELKRNHLLVDVINFKLEKNEKKPISSIAKSSLSQPKFSSFLRLLLNYLNAESVLETGTSLGVNALYMSSSSSIEKVITLEGSPIIAELAKKQFQKENAKKIELIQGNIYETFVPALVKNTPDVIFLDADHRSVAIDFYVENIMNHLPQIKCIVIHDIYWSQDMFEKWQEITTDNRFTLTVDIFQAGLIFPNQEMPKQHFKLKF
jgi:predicted O-methyltransferase YrrM